MSGTPIYFSDRDWAGLLLTKGTYNFTSNITTSTDYTEIQVGGLANLFPAQVLQISGQATSPASFGSNPSDRVIYLEVTQTPRGTLFDSGSAITARYQILKWKVGETSTVKELTIPLNIFLNTFNRTDGNIWVRLVSGNGTFTAVDMALNVLGNSNSVFPSVAPVTTTNNLRSITTSASTNTVQEIPTSTAGYIEFKASKYGYFGDVKTDNKFGLSPTGDTGPKYYWEFNQGGTVALARAVHNASVVANDISYTEGDVLRVERDASGNYTYKKNGSTEGTGGSTDTTPQRGDILFVRQDSRLLNIRMDIGAGEISPTFENLVNVETF
jgi:hypothetical protein